MILVRSGLGDDVDNAIARTSDLRGESGCRNLKLLDRIFREIGERASNYLVVVVTTVDGDVTASTEATCRANFEGVRLCRIERWRGAVSRYKICKLEKVPAIEGNARNRLGRDLTLNHGLREIDRIVDSSHVQRLFRACRMQPHINGLCFTRCENQALGLRRGEGWALNPQVVRSNFQGGKYVQTFGIRLRLP